MRAVKEFYAARNAEIYRLYEVDGMRQKEIGLIYGLSESRVKVICAEQRAYFVMRSGEVGNGL